MKKLSGRTKERGAEERARKAVAKRIKVAKKQIKEKHPSLGLHLSQEISCGVTLNYNPKKEISWDVKY